jgi:hypothetical protein
MNDNVVAIVALALVTMVTLDRLPQFVIVMKDLIVRLRPPKKS